MVARGRGVGGVTGGAVEEDGRQEDINQLQYNSYNRQVLSPGY